MLYPCNGVDVWTWLKFSEQVLYLSFSCLTFSRLAWMVHLDMLMDLDLDAESEPQISDTG